MKTLIIVLLFVTVFTVIAGIGAFVTQWAWNLVMPYLFKLPNISLLQAFGINILIGTIRSVFVVRSK